MSNAPRTPLKNIRKGVIAQGVFHVPHRQTGTTAYSLTDPTALQLYAELHGEDYASGFDILIEEGDAYRVVKDVLPDGRVRLSDNRVI